MISNKLPFNEEHGYTLIIVTMMISVLLLLGFTANTLCSDNYKMKNTNSRYKKSFYLAEALSEEADMKLHEYLKIAVYNSYELVLKYVIENDIDYDMDVEEINRKFKTLFKQEIKSLEDKLENTDDYNLKIIEKYNTLVEVNLEKCLDTEDFNVSILSTFNDLGAIEKINTKYIIKLPEYSDFNHNKDLINQVDWANYKW